MSESAQPALVAISHGTSSPAGQAAVAGLVRAVARAAPGIITAAGFVDVQHPDVAETLATVPTGRATVVVPLLLSAGYHVHVDLTEAVLADGGHPVRLAAALGPHALLTEVLRLRLRQAGAGPGDAIVLAVAGSSDARAVVDCHAAARMLSDALDEPVSIGFLAAEPRLADAVTAARAEHPHRRVIVSSYLLAPGYFHDLARAAGGDATTDPLLVDSAPAPRELVQLVLERHRESAVAERPIVGRSALARGL